MPEEYKIQPGSPQPNFTPIGLDPIQQSQGFQIDDNPRANMEPVTPNNWDDNATNGAKAGSNLRNSSGEILDDQDVVNTIKLTSGEALTIGPKKALYSEDATTEDKEILTQTTYTDNPNNGQDMGVVSGNQKLAQSFVEGGLAIKKIKVRLVQVGAVVDDVRVGIQADVGGAPSGTFLSSGTTTGTTLATDPSGSEERTITLAAEVITDRNVKYWIVVERTGSLHASNYYKMFLSTGSANPYANGDYAIYNGTSWSVTTTDDFYFKLITTTVEGRVYLASGAAAGTANTFIGFNKDVFGAGEQASIRVAGKIDGFTGLTIGALYYLSDTYGAISTTPGTVSKKVGVATSATELLIIQT